MTPGTIVTGLENAFLLKKSGSLRLAEKTVGFIRMGAISGSRAFPTPKKSDLKNRNRLEAIRTVPVLMAFWICQVTLPSGFPRIISLIQIIPHSLKRETKLFEAEALECLPKNKPPRIASLLVRV